MTALALLGATLLMSTAGVDEVERPVLWRTLTASGCLLVVVALLWWWAS